MKNVRQAFACALYRFRQWRYDPRVYITFLLAWILCFLLSGKIVSVSEEYDLSVQFLEPFIWTFGDGESVLLSSLLLLFLFSDIPSVSRATPFFLVRTKRSVWLWGQILYIAAGTVLYLVFIVLSSAFFCMGNAYTENVWSHTSVMLGYTGAGKAISVPASVRIMEFSSPLGCAARIFLLMLAYMLLLSSLLLFINLKKGTRAGTVAALGFSLYGFLTDPDTFTKLLGLSGSEFYLANVLTGWLSPLNHAVLARHNFGYDHLPTLAESYLLFGVLIGICILFSRSAIKKYGFDFSGIQGG